MDSARYWMGVLVVTWLPPALLWWFPVHPFIEFWRRMGPRVTLAVMGVIYVAGVLALVPVRDAILVRDLGAHPAVLAAAAVLVAASFWIAAQRKKHLTLRILAGVPELDPEGPESPLLTSGIYGRIRHPRYVEIALGTLGYALFSNWLGALVVGIATVPLDEYERYRRAVPRYLPRRRSP